MRASAVDTASFSGIDLASLGVDGGFRRGGGSSIVKEMSSQTNLGMLLICLLGFPHFLRGGLVMSAMLSTFRMTYF